MRTTQRPPHEQGERRSIRTRYKNILFRSKLEADWARAFDVMGIEWRYEPHGQFFGDVFYLVDFYLPRSDQWVEVKGSYHLEPADVEKMNALVAHYPTRRFTNDDTPNVPLVVCWPFGTFHAWDPKRGTALVTEPVVAFQCEICGGWWFAVESGGWTCQCCGAGGGNGHIANRIESPVRGFPDLKSLRHACRG